jgi:hypothetical protein
MHSINSAASDLIDADGAEEASRVVRRAARNVLAAPMPDERLAENLAKIIHKVALEYRRACRLAATAGATESDCQRAAVEAAIGRHQQLDPMAPFNRHDAADTVLEMVGNVILAEPFWFWHGPDA